MINAPHKLAPSIPELEQVLENIPVNEGNKKSISDLKRIIKMRKRQEDIQTLDKLEELIRNDVQGDGQQALRDKLRAIAEEIRGTLHD